MDKMAVSGPGIPITPKELGTVLSVRMPGPLAGQLREAANARGCSVSDLLREATQRLVGIAIGWRCDHMNVSGLPVVSQPSFGCGCAPQPVFNVTDLELGASAPRQ